MGNVIAFDPDKRESKREPKFPDGRFVDLPEDFNNAIREGAARCLMSESEFVRRILAEGLEAFGLMPEIKPNGMQRLMGLPPSRVYWLADEPQTEMNRSNG